MAALLTAPVTGAVTAGSAAATPAFEKPVYTAQQGETAEIVINTTGADDAARLTVGDAADTNFEVRATVTDADGDGALTVRFDTGAVHESGPESYLTVVGDDAIDNRTEVAGVDEPLDPAPYNLSLGDPDNPPSTASLALLAGDQTESPTTRRRRRSPRTTARPSIRPTARSASLPRPGKPSPARRRSIPGRPSRSGWPRNCRRHRSC